MISKHDHVAARLEEAALAAGSIAQLFKLATFVCCCLHEADLSYLCNVVTMSCDYTTIRWPATIFFVCWFGCCPSHAQVNLWLFGVRRRCCTNLKLAAVLSHRCQLAPSFEAPYEDIPATWSRLFSHIETFIWLGIMHNHNLFLRLEAAFFA